MLAEDVSVGSIQYRHHRYLIVVVRPKKWREEHGHQDGRTPKRACASFLSGATHASCAVCKD